MPRPSRPAPRSIRSPPHPNPTRRFTLTSKASCRRPPQSLAPPKNPVSRFNPHPVPIRLSPPARHTPRPDRNQLTPFFTMIYKTATPPTRLASPPALSPAVGAFRMDGPPESSEAGGKGPARYYGRFIPNLPLRGKLGWMTPRSRCENDAGYETRLLEAPDPKRGPHFFPATPRCSAPHLRQRRHQNPATPTH